MHLLLGILESLLYFAFEEGAFRKASHHEDEVDGVAFDDGGFDELCDFLFDLFEEGGEEAGHQGGW